MFVNEVDGISPQMSETFTLGESITHDKKLSKNKRDEVDGQLTLLINRWDRIQDFVALREGRYVPYLSKRREANNNRGSQSFAASQENKCRRIIRVSTSAWTILSAVLQEKKRWKVQTTYKQLINSLAHASKRKHEKKVVLNIIHKAQDPKPHTQ